MTGRVHAGEAPSSGGPERAAAEALLLQCARISPSPAVIESLVPDVDWTHAVEQALFHRIEHPFLRALQLAPTGTVPSNLLAALHVRCDVLKSQSDRVLNELFGLLDDLGGHGVRAIPFKGPILGHLLFADIAGRNPGDIDLLIREADISASRRVLEARGYIDAGVGHHARPLTQVQRTWYERYHCEYQYARDADDSVVEPHWGLCQRALCIDIDYGGMLDRAGNVAVNGRQLPALSPEDLLVALSVHGAKHRWQRLAWVRDVAGVLTAFPELNLEPVLSQARDRGYLRILLLSLLLARDLAGARVGANVSQMVESDPTLVNLSADIQRCLFDLSAPEVNNDQIDRFRVAVRERWQDRLWYSVYTALFPRRRHLEVIALPAMLAWGYYGLKVGIDYAMAPTWAVVKGLR